ncbi:MAG: ubiquinol-cytochrome C chaperone family protein [Hyphomicrobiaceae bacterium]|nr:ubiquinol-cytochrome C chaperone family protein [Hyphomicrobiaceae bacterium]
MFNWLSARKAHRATVETVYEAVIASARRPELYRDVNVPDTTEGRYEMVVVHLVIVLERLRAEGDATAPLSRDLIERFVIDMDDCMREIGVGDLSVPKKVRRAAAGLWERAELYRPSLGPSGDRAALARALAEAMAGLPDAEDPAVSPTPIDFAALAADLATINDRVAATPLDRLLAGAPLAPDA